MISLERTRSDHPDDDCLSDLALDQVRVGELASETISAHLDACGRCRARQRSLAEAHLAVELPPLDLTSKELTPQDLTPQDLKPLDPPPQVKPRRRWAQTSAAGLAIAAAALLLIIVRPATPLDDPEPSTHNPTPTTRTKGAPTLHFHIRRDGTILKGGPGDALHPGDALRFAYSWSEGGAIAVLSRDGAGTISAYFPAGEHTYAAAAGEEIDLPGAVLLDEVLGDEVLYGFFCRSELPLLTLERAIEARPDDPSVRGCAIDRVRVDKRAAP